MPWPLPALLAWASAWAAWAGAVALGLPSGLALTLGLCLGAALASRCQGLWRRGLAAAGFPLSALILGLAGDLPAWAWLAVLLPLWLLYPVRAWRDAPYFPTPAGALSGLSAVVTPNPTRVLDAGCGLGHGLLALRALWPDARIDGIEWSRPLSWAAAWRCPWARVRRADMWAADWSDYGLVYLFQRPESMSRAFHKAQREMASGAWLVSLEFEVPGRDPVAKWAVDARRSAWVYRIDGGADTARICDSTATLACR